MTKIIQSLRNKTFLLLTVLSVGASNAYAGLVTEVNGYDFDLSQFTGSTVTYRTAGDGGTVAFDGKLWDNANGVNGFTLGELAAGQYGSDPGDQVSLNNRTTPDWLQLNYGAGIEISASAHELVIFEISSSNTVDLEGTSFQVMFNGLGLNLASAASSITNFATAGAENVNQIVFDLYDFGFSNGDIFNTLYIENLDSGSGTSDPDFIFAGIAGDLTAVPEPSVVTVFGLGLLGLSFLRRRQMKV